MSQRYPDRLPIHRVAKLWAAEASVDPQDIEDDLIDAALNGEFQFRPDEIVRGEDGALPANFDIRLGLQIEIFNQNGDRVTDLDLKKSINSPDPGPWSPGVPPPPLGRDARRREVAKKTLVSMNGLRRWCEQPGFPEWATPRGLKRPNFIAERKVATTIAAATNCQRWLEREVAAWRKKPGSPLPRKREMRNAALNEFKRLSARSFDKAWDQIAPEEWKHGGRRSKSPH